MTPVFALASCDAAAFATVGLAEPKLAKAGGARRDRTADLVIANDALSQLSYGPVMAASLRRPTIGAIYDQRQGQVKNAEIAVFCGFFSKELPLFGRGGTGI